MSRKVLLAFLLAAGVALTGCGGGGGGGGGGQAITPGVSIMVGADTAVGTAMSESRQGSTRAVTNLVAPLDDGAVVSVYNFQTGDLIKTGTLSGGWCELKDIPAGLSLAIVVTGKRAGKDYRLSTLVPVVVESGAQYVADPTTSVAAEAFALQHFAKNKVFSQDDLAPVLNAARQFAQTHSDADFSVGGGIFTGTAFGKSGSLNASAPDINNVIASVGTIDDKLARAKNTVTLIEEAGTPLRALLDPELVDFRNVFTEQVISRYQTLAENMGKLLLPAISIGGMLMAGGPDDLTIGSLTLGRRYIVTGTNPDGRLIIQDAGAGTPNQISIQRDLSLGGSSGVYTVVGKKTGSNWEITQTFTGDSQQQYTMVVPEVSFGQGPGANPTLAGTASLKDKNFTTPITLSVTLAASGADPDHYTSITFNGTLVTPQVSSSGAFRADFAASPPPGAAQWQKHYDFPTAFSMTDGRIVVKTGSKTITIEGDLTGTTQFVRLAEAVETIPANVAFMGKYANTHTGLNFEGSINLSASYEAGQNDARPKPGSTASLQGLLVKQGHPTYSLNLSANRTATGITANLNLVAATISLSGTTTLTIDQGTGDVTGASAALTSSTGVLLELARSGAGQMSGIIKVEGVKVADVLFPPHAVRINFTDGTFKEYQF
ncbi:MAG: hypothetical protein ACP5R5_09675 [Armatimonadota bacterium]